MGEGGQCGVEGDERVGLQPGHREVLARDGGRGAELLGDRDAMRRETRSPRSLIFTSVERSWRSRAS